MTSIRGGGLGNCLVGDFTNKLNILQVNSMFVGKENVKESQLCSIMTSVQQGVVVKVYQHFMTNNIFI